MPLLSGCSLVRSNVAPSVVEYSKDFQKQVAQEIISGSCPASTEMIKDYSVMRDQARVQ